MTDLASFSDAAALRESGAALASSQPFATSFWRRSSAAFCAFAASLPP